jgi:hypothetical protein
LSARPFAAVEQREADELLHGSLDQRRHSAADGVVEAEVQRNLGDGWGLTRVAVALQIRLLHGESTILMKQEACCRIVMLE